MARKIGRLSQLLIKSSQAVQIGSTILSYLEAMTQVTEMGIRS
jgi:hypothetical protein